MLVVKQTWMLNKHFKDISGYNTETMYSRIPTEDVHRESHGNKQRLQLGKESIYLKPSGPRQYRIPERKFVRHSVGQILIGVCCIVAQITAIVIDMENNFHYAGTYCSIFYILAGIYGFRSARRKTIFETVVFMLLCVVAAGFSLVQFFCTVHGLHQTHLPSDFRYHVFENTDTSVTERLKVSVSFLCAVVLLILAFTECLITVVCASLSAKALWCENDTMTAYMRSEDGEIQIPITVVLNKDLTAEGFNWLLNRPLRMDAVNGQPVT